MSEFDIVSLDKIMAIYESGYRDRWIGRRKFLTHTIPNTSGVAFLTDEDGLAAVANLNRNRVIAFSVAMSSQRKGYGVRLFQEIVAVCPDAWFTVVTDALPFLRTVTNQKLNFQLVEDQARIEDLFREIRGVGRKFKVHTFQETNTYLSSRMDRQGSPDRSFTTFYRPGSIHTPDYHQFVFQNVV